MTNPPARRGEASAWLPIESAPREMEGDAILLWNQRYADDDQFVGHPYVVSNRAYVATRTPDYLRRHGFTHWQPLPAPPAPAEGSGDE